MREGLGGWGRGGGWDGGGWEPVAREASHAPEEEAQVSDAPKARCQGAQGKRGPQVISVSFNYEKLALLNSF